MKGFCKLKNGLLFLNLKAKGKAFGNGRTVGFSLKVLGTAVENQGGATLKVMDLPLEGQDGGGFTNEATEATSAAIGKKLAEQQAYK